MGALEDWREFASAFDSGAPSNRGGSDWALIFSRRTRMVALPARTISDSTSLRFFILTARKRLWARVALIFHRLVPAVLPQSRLSDRQHGELQRILDGDSGTPAARPGSVMAIQFGSRGPLQKVTVLARSSEGTLVVGKFALRASADERIDIEATCLERLVHVPALASNVPDLISSGRTSAGRRFFVMSAVAGNPTGNTYGREHADFLLGLSTVDARIDAWDRSELVHQIEMRLAQLAEMQNTDLQVLRAGWGAACSALMGRDIPVCLSHGDFASWNLLQSMHGLIALDWEYARPFWNPLGDFFHFHLIPAALDGSLLRSSFRRDLLIAKASEHAQAVFRVDPGFAATIALPLLLVYLIDTITFYAVVSGGIDRQHPVVNSYWRCVSDLT
jgi:hypothetical protein